MSAIPSARNALDLIASLHAPGHIDPGLARSVSANLRYLLDAGHFGPLDALLL